ncbi:hypothetical protein PTKIN_Ptkin05aG0091600 [Pterospermum kingtungense]
MVKVGSSGIAKTQPLQFDFSGKNIDWARSSESNKLELRFRPEDPYSHPAFGVLRTCNNLLLKISEKKCSNGQNAEASGKLQECSTSGATVSQNPAQPSKVEEQRPEDEKTNLCADIVSRVSKAYHFNGMADYQHVIAVHADAARKRKRNLVEAEEPPFEKGGFMDADQDAIMMILPPVFSPKDMPDNIVLRSSTILSSQNKEEEAVQHSAEVELELGLAIDFNIKDILMIAFYFFAGFNILFPIGNSRYDSRSYWLYILLQIPKKVNWVETPGSEQWELQKTVSKLFDKRPIWPKVSVKEQLLEKGLSCSNGTLKRLLVRVAYYFSNGPFLRFWIKKGYDPRKDPDSRIYQRTEFRVPEPLRSYVESIKANESEHRWKDLCSFQVFPNKCQTFLQLFELDDEYIQLEIRKPPKLSTCDSKTGWFSECLLECLRLRVTVRFLSVYPEPGAHRLLKSCSDDFEKLKRSCIYKDVFNPHQEENQQTTRGDEDKERLKSSDNEEDEIEADDEEDLDVDETLNLGGEDDEIPLQPDTYIDMENNSRTYLQELFGSFPSTAPDADAIQTADTSDGEYQIYEQFSDNDYSDDDDDDDDDDDS